MSLVVVGSVAIDTVETPQARREDILGGSAVFFAFGASYFTPVHLVGVVGEDWPEAHTQFLRSRNIDLEGLEIQKGGETFRWTGRYLDNMNDRETLDVKLNVLADFDPKLPESYRRCRFLFLANGSVTTQLKAVEQCPGAELTVADTMDLWISTQRDELTELLTKIDGIVLNDSEAKLLAEDTNLIEAGYKILEMGPRFVVVKKGEHGVMFLSEHEIYVLPAYPTRKLIDPTGAGDSFAGGMMGYLAEQGKFDPETLKKALAYGTLVAGITVEGFSLDALTAVERKDLDHRMDQYRRMLTF